MKSQKSFEFDSNFASESIKFDEQSLNKSLWRRPEPHQRSRNPCRGWKTRCASQISFKLYASTASSFPTAAVSSTAGATFVPTSVPSLAPTRTPMSTMKAAPTSGPTRFGTNVLTWQYIGGTGAMDGIRGLPTIARPLYKRSVTHLKLVSATTSSNRMADTIPCYLVDYLLMLLGSLIVRFHIPLQDGRTSNLVIPIFA